MCDSIFPHEAPRFPHEAPRFGRVRRDRILSEQKEEVRPSTGTARQQDTNL